MLPNTGGREYLFSVFENGGAGKPDILYSVEDVLKHYELDQKHLEQGAREFNNYPVLVRVPPGDEQSSAKRMRGLTGIKVALPNYYTRPLAKGLHYNEQFITDAIQAVRLQEGKPECGKGVTVAILDTGIDSSVSNAVPQFDTDRPRDRKSGLKPYDPVGHGTMVARLLRTGAPGVTILPIKVAEDHGNLMGLVAGLYVSMAYQMPDIFNLSLGVTLEAGICPYCHVVVNAPVTFDQIALLFGQIDEVYRLHGYSEPLLIAAAGNVRPGAPLMMPASLEKIVAVGACEDFDSEKKIKLATYSEYESVPSDRFFLAPGGKDSPGECFATHPATAQGPGSTTWYQERLYGTSFAAPLVTAVAARYLCSTIQGSGCGIRGVGKQSKNHKFSTRKFLMKCLKEAAFTGFRGFKNSSHGLGLVKYNLEIARELASAI